MARVAKLPSSKSSADQSSKGGRPASGTLERRLEQLVNDATQVFLQNGYGSTTLDLVAQKAHVAKRTIYRHFGGKEELFGAVVRQRIDTLVALFPDVDADDGSLEQVLKGFAHELLAVVLSPETISLYRIITGEASRFPELAQQFYNNGPAQVIALLARYLAHQQQLKKIQLNDPETAAVQLFSLIQGEFERRAMLDIDQPYSAEQINQHVDDTIHFFLSAYRV